MSNLITQLSNVATGYFGGMATDTTAQAKPAITPPSLDRFVRAVSQMTPLGLPLLADPSDKRTGVAAVGAVLLIGIGLSLARTMWRHWKPILLQLKSGQQTRKFGWTLKFSRIPNLTTFSSLRRQPQRFFLFAKQFDKFAKGFVTQMLHVCDVMRCLC